MRKQFIESGTKSTAARTKNGNVREVKVYRRATSYVPATTRSKRTTTIPTRTRIPHRTNQRGTTKKNVLFVNDNATVERFLLFICFCINIIFSVRSSSSSTLSSHFSFLVIVNTIFARARTFARTPLDRSVFFPMERLSSVADCHRRCVIEFLRCQCVCSPLTITIPRCHPSHSPPLFYFCFHIFPGTFSAAPPSSTCGAYLLPIELLCVYCE